MKMVRFLLIVSFVMASLVGSANAAEPVYAVDMQRVINESIIGKAARSNMEADVKRKEGQLSKLQGDLKAMKAELDKQGSLLSADALKTKRQSFESKERELQKNFQESREELLKKNNLEIGKIVKEIDGIVKNLAKEKGYKMVVEKDQRFVVYIDPQYDITDEVISMLDKKKMES